MKNDYRLEKDSMGEVRVPRLALYGAQTQRAVENFTISTLRLPHTLIEALGLIKASAARVNADLGLLDKKIAASIEKAAMAVASGKHHNQFPLDIFQTGSGTSSNMNANEVIATLASRLARKPVHPNDHVNMGQSSNDVIPTAIHVSGTLLCHRELLPALSCLASSISKKSKKLKNVVTTGRTHLMDAMPITFEQLMSGWKTQIENGSDRVRSGLQRLTLLPQGGTAIGTGINTHPQFGRRFAAQMKKRTGISFKTAPNYFEALSSQDASCEMSGQLKTIAISLMKIANDLRWMNSGPLAGIAEIELPAMQPGSSIMPGKVNPVIPEAVTMVAAQVIGNDATIAVAGQSGNFQLNVMLPVIGYNLCQSIEILSQAARSLADPAISGFRVNRVGIEKVLAKNPILVTALNPLIGYEQGAKIAKRAYAEKRPVREVADEETNLGKRLNLLLDPKRLTKGGVRRT